MSMTPEVEAAVAELREAFPDATITAVPDPQGGAAVTVDPVALGEQYVPQQSWIKFQITFQYPMSDVYPHFVLPELKRADGATLGEGISLGTFSLNGQPEQAMQLSRRSNKLNPATDTAALKLEKVLAWLRGK
jgi:hypothetical protein